MNNDKARNFLLGLALLTACSTGLKAQIWVGGDPQCDHQNIQDALNEVLLGVDTEIRIANNISGGEYIENLDFDYNLTETIAIRGGYDACQGTLTETPSVVNGNDLNPVFNISGGNPGQRVTIILSRLAFKNGRADGSGRAGGLNLSSVSTSFFLRELSISNNTGVKGGGLYINLLDDTGLEVSGTLIFNNSGTNGGGVYCEQAGEARSLLFQADNAISFNQAISGVAGNGNGGGVYLTNGCSASLNSGDALFGSVEGIVGNQASNHGGGVFISNGAFLRLNQREVPGDGVSIATIAENIADADFDGSGNGGGIYLTGIGTRLSFSEGSLNRNQAVNGGGIALADEATSTFVFSGASQPACYFGSHCVEFSRNVAGQNVSGVGQGVGGAIFAESSSQLGIVRTRFTENQADNGVVMGATDLANIRISASTMYNNGGEVTSELAQNYMFLASEEGTNLEMKHVTVVDNEVNPSSRMYFGALGARIRVDNSLLFDAVDVLEVIDINGSDTQTIFDCVMAHEISTLSGAVGNSFQVLRSGLSFVDPGAGDYRIGASSAAIDLCSDVNSAFSVDFEGQALGYDDPATGELFGAFDAGSDEYYLIDAVFADRFE